MATKSVALRDVAQRKTDAYYMRMDPAVKAAGEKAAEDDHRSLASLIEKLLVTYLTERGYLPKRRQK